MWKPTDIAGCKLWLDASNSGSAGTFTSLFTMGGGGTTYPFDGDIASLLIFDTTHNIAAKQAIEAYTTWEYFGGSNTNDFVYPWTTTVSSAQASSGGT